MRRLTHLIDGWSFRRVGTTQTPEPWEAVELPHSPFVSDPDGRNHWFGICEYRRTVVAPALEPGERIRLHVGAAMQVAEVLVAGREIARHAGGYLPFEVDLTDVLRDRPVELLLRLDNRDNAAIPPGKPFRELDFCWYGGLYRSVEWRIRPAVHLTEPVSAGVVAGGGVFVRTLSATPTSARLHGQAQVGNSGDADRNCRVRFELRHRGAVAALAQTEVRRISAGTTQTLAIEIAVDHPLLWSPAQPRLYDVVVTVLDEGGESLDEQQLRYGIRRLGFSRAHGLTINGQRLRLRGTNRHQEMPAVGYAGPAAAQYRDALRIKRAGFDYVRLSHYPQSPDFLDACDEVGLVVMNCIPGWQFLGDEQFRSACLENARQLVRRDRNHACVVLWELSLNETRMEPAFAARLHALGHEEYPGDQMFTCGWMDHYDVFIRSRQHGGIHTWQSGDKALVVAEYGDWEFFARNEGFDQTTGQGLLDPLTNSRQLRGSGERGLLQQARNHQLALTDVLSSPAVLDGQWAMFDYARGYDPNRAAVGVMDHFRLPKFSYHFYRSQRHAGELVAGEPSGYEVFIASHWTRTSDLRVTVYSNCAEIELRLNGVRVARQVGIREEGRAFLPHPPYRFDLPQFAPGKLEALGFVEGRLRARHAVATPGPAASIELVVDDAGRFPRRGEPDVLLAHARVLDGSGQLAVEDAGPIAFAITGASLLGAAEVHAEAGIASAVVRLPHDAAGFTLVATRRDGALSPATVQWQREKTKSRPATGRDLEIITQQSAPQPR